MASVANTCRRIGRIPAASPSRANSLLKCPLTEAFRFGNAAPRLPTHPKAHFGIIAHALLREATRGAYLGFTESDVRSAWRRHVQLHEEKLRSDTAEAGIVPLSQSCDDFEVNGYRLVKAVLRISSRPQHPPSTKKFQLVSSESKLSSRDGMIVGRLDRIIWRDGRLVVADIKTGNIYDPSGELSQELQMQLLLYAYLISEAFGDWPDALSVLPLHGEALDMAFTPKRAVDAATETKDALARANLMIDQILQGKSDESALAAPSEDSCRFCRFRPTCQAYWTARIARPELRWPRDVTGTVVSIRPQGRQISIVELAAKNGSSMTIRGVTANGVRDIALGGAIRVCDLKAERAAGVFAWRSTSVALAAS